MGLHSSRTGVGLAPGVIPSLSLFAGIGGMSLGLRPFGFSTACYVEQDAFCQRVLQARMRDGHLDDAPIWGDITQFDPMPWRGRIAAIEGGFPCTDLSNAGRRAGIDGKHSGLWREFARIIGVVRPRYVLLENVSAIVVRGLDRVLADLAEMGFDAEWCCIRASDAGAPHRRERWFCLAHRPERGLGELRESPGSDRLADRRGAVMDDAQDAHRRRRVAAVPGGLGIGRGGSGGASPSLADSDIGGRELLGGGGVLDGQRTPSGHDADGRSGAPAGVGLADSGRKGLEGWPIKPAREERSAAQRGCDTPFWPPGPADTEGWRRVLAERPWLVPAMPRKAVVKSVFRREFDGTPAWLEYAYLARRNRLKALGNLAMPAQVTLAFSILFDRLWEFAES